MVVDVCFFLYKQETAYEMRISDWCSDVCSSDLINVKGGTLAFNSDAALGAPDGIVTIEENTTLKTLADFTISHDLNVNNTQLAAFDTNGHDIVMAGDIGGAGVVQKIGSGTLTLTGNNSQVLIDVLGGRLIASSQG